MTVLLVDRDRVPIVVAGVRILAQNRPRGGHQNRRRCPSNAIGEGTS
jgi:hypothetical protein